MTISDGFRSSSRRDWPRSLEELDQHDFREWLRANGLHEAPGESWRVAHVLGSKGVPNRVDLWGKDRAALEAALARSTPVGDMGNASRAPGRVGMPSCRLAKRWRLLKAMASGPGAVSPRPQRSPAAPARG